MNSDLMKSAQSEDLPGNPRIYQEILEIQWISPQKRAEDFMINVN